MNDAPRAGSQPAEPPCSGGRAPDPATSHDAASGDAAADAAAAAAAAAADAAPRPPSPAGPASALVPAHGGALGAEELQSKPREELVAMCLALDRQKQAAEQEKRQMAHQLGLLRGYLQQVVGQGRALERALSLPSGGDQLGMLQLEGLHKPGHAKRRSADLDQPAVNYRKRARSGDAGAQLPEGASLALRRLQAPGGQLQLYRLDVLQPGGQLARQLFLPSDALALAGVPGWARREDIPAQASTRRRPRPLLALTAALPAPPVSQPAAWASPGRALRRRA
jgi:hypothetical protein